MRMIVRVLLLLTHLFILFYKEGIHMLINFNIPPFTGKETEYMTKAIQNHKISGDGEFTKKCNKWIEDKTGTAKALLTTSCTHATEMVALLADIKPGWMKLSCHLIHSFLLQMHLFCVVLPLYL